MRLCRRGAGKMGLEKIDVTKLFREGGDFVPLGEEYAVDGWADANTKKGTVKTLRLVRVKDGLQFSVFADQLRMDGGTLFVSAAQLTKQIARQEAYAKQGASLKQ